MKFGEALEATGRIIEELLNRPDCASSMRWNINTTDQALIEELFNAANGNPFLNCQVIGVVDGPTQYLIISAKYPYMKHSEYTPPPKPPEGRLIEIDFRAKRLLLRAA